LIFSIVSLRPFSIIVKESRQQKKKKKGGEYREREKRGEKRGKRGKSIPFYRKNSKEEERRR